MRRRRRRRRWRRRRRRRRKQNSSWRWVLNIGGLNNPPTVVHRNTSPGLTPPDDARFFIATGPTIAFTSSARSSQMQSTHCPSLSSNQGLIHVHFSA
jgi:hypothetical protein